MILGLVAAKENSNRFPGKNKYILDGKPLFWYSVEPLLQSELIDDLYVVTDSEFIQNYCLERNVKTIWRPKNATRDEDKLINILRFAYFPKIIIPIAMVFESLIFFTIHFLIFILM